jgi:anti-sigma regulatory factor (Ser/Thr protein kinase)/ActR/RegA family two-component response regulator
MGRLLVIGNDPALLAALRTSHHLTSHDVESCAGPFEAALLIRNRAFDVFITDQTSAANDGLTLSRELRALRPGLRAIVLAPALSSTEVIDALREHVYACFTRPIDYEEVADMARAAIEDSDWRSAIEVLSGLPHWITLRVACRLVTADRLTRFMTEHRSDLPSEQRDLLMTAFRELLLNAMEHGAGFDPEQVIEVTAARTARTIVFHFRDPGKGFDRTDLSHAAKTPNPNDVIANLDEREATGLRPGGFGMLIVRHIVDELVYNEPGNEVIMIKHLK